VVKFKQEREPGPVVSDLALLELPEGRPDVLAVVDGKTLVMITGANQGGKSTFLRSIGLAQLMMQCGMFVPAESFSANVSSGVFTHYKRAEDATMTSGKLDEELGRMSEIADTIAPGALLLCSESFAATNEREGSHIARNIVRGMLDSGIKVMFVTHFYDLARGFEAEGRVEALFLRAERAPDGTRTFRIKEDGPLLTSHAQDIYEQIFGSSP
jgi:DNA mismatch repair ATPase MutS